MPLSLDSFPGQNGSSEGPSGPSKTISPGTKGLALGGPPEASDRPYLPKGWLNTPAGSRYLTKRVEMFSSRTSSQMDFGFIKKRDK